MKDAYTFDRDAEGLNAAYDKHIVAYDRIFDRTGLEWYRVEGDVGMMGGLGAHEYMARARPGRTRWRSRPGTRPTSRSPPPIPAVELPPALPAPEAVATPGMTTVDSVARELGSRPERC